MVSFAEVEQLKQKLTDKYVVVDKNAPELRRFSGLTGLVKTVNMSGRALVQFDGPVDIGWYDIDPTFLTLVDQPLPKKVETKSAPAEKAPAAKPAAGGKSPLELAREQAAKAAAAKGGAAPAKPAGGKSPLELAREQAAKALAAKAQASPAPTVEAAPSEAAAESPSPAAPPAKASSKVSMTDESGKPLSPLEIARRQGAFKGK